jgi:hypothetical protein
MANGNLLAELRVMAASDSLDETTYRRLMLAAMADVYSQGTEVAALIEKLKTDAEALEKRVTKLESASRWSERRDAGSYLLSMLAVLGSLWKLKP